MSPRSENNITTPLYASTPLVNKANEAATSCNGLDQVDNRKSDPNKNYEDMIHTNGNIGDDNLVSQSTISMDILSGGESDACDTLTRTNQNNNSIISTTYLSPTGTESRSYRRFTDDIQYCVAKELLMTERTYKKDLELVTVSWSEQVSNLAGEPSDVMDALGRPCLALEPLALPQGVLLANLDRCITLSIHETEPKEPNYKRISDILHDYLLNTYDAYKWYSDRAGALVARLENVRRTTATANAICHAFDCSSPLPLTLLILRPLHRLIYYKDIAQQLSHGESSSLVDTCTELCDSARTQLEHSENHVALCQLQRDIIGYDKLLLPEREFIQFGCLYKHSSKGLVQRMIFLFTDILVIASKSSSGSQFRAHAALSLHNMVIEKADMPHSFTLHYDNNNIVLSPSNEVEFAKWYDIIQEAIDSSPEISSDLTITHMEPGSSTSNVSCVPSTGVAWTHVCWHRATSLHRDRLHIAMMTQQSGYLLRKFKNSHGWQKLWVVFAAFALFFYKSWQDGEPLASLPLLGYTVSPPNESDAINKEFVFKLQFKNHVYFFRADTQYTYTRWTEALQQATSHRCPD